MASAIYKPGQGYWTRLMSAMGAGAIILAGAAWLWNIVSGAGGENILYYQAGAALGVIIVFGSLLFWLLNKPRVVDFMIATEAEMKKVNWPTRREVMGSTWIVICGTFLLAAIVWVVDLLFVAVFIEIGILQGASPIRNFLASLFGF